MVEATLQEFRSWVGKELFGIEKFNSIDEVTDRVLYDLVSGTDLGAVPAEGVRMDQQAQERAEIERKAKENGTWLKAPNGADTNLTPEQWVTVRTNAFKNWFGDWEKAARIEKWRVSKSASISGNEIQTSDDMKQYRKNAFAYGKSLRGEYRNADTGRSIVINRDSLTEVLHHDGSNVAHIQSIAAIPQMVEQGIYIASEPVSADASEKLKNAKEVQYYVCGLNIGGVPYTVKFVVAEYENGDRYYDHSLTRIEKGDLLNRAELSSTVADGKSPISDIKDKRLVSILQTNSSKIVDANGEPKVVYHQTNAKVYINRETGQNWDELDWRERMEWDERDDWDDYWIEQDFTKFTRVNARTTQELDGFFFAPEYDEYHEYGDRTIAAFLNIRKPASPREYNIDGSQNDAGREERLRLQSEGFDGVIREYDGAIDEYIAFNPNQIKSAEGNTTFDLSNDDIRFNIADEQVEMAGEQIDIDGTDAELREKEEKQKERIASKAARVEKSLERFNKAIRALSKQLQRAKANDRTIAQHIAPLFFTWARWRS